MRDRNPLPGRTPGQDLGVTDATLLRMVEIPSSEYVAEEGAHLQSTDYDGTDFATADATQGWRLENDGNLDAQNVRASGTVQATDLILDGFTLFSQGDGFEADTESWNTLGLNSNCTVARTTADFDSGVASLEITATASGVDFIATSDAIPLPDDEERPLALVIAINNVNSTYLDVVYYWLDSGLAVLDGPNNFITPPMAAGWTSLAGLLETRPAGAEYVVWGVKGAASTVTAGDKVRADVWSLNLVSYIRGATFSTAPTSDAEAGEVRLLADAIRFTPALAQGAAASLYRTGDIDAAATRSSAGVLRPFLRLGPPSFDADYPEILLRGSPDVGSNPSQIDLEAELIEVNSAPLLRFGAMGKNANTVINSGTPSYVTFETEADTTGGAWIDLPAWSIVVPANTAGVIDITYRCRFASNATGYRFASIEKNGTRVAGDLRNAVNGNVTIICVNYKGEVTGGEQFMFVAEHTAGVPLNVVPTNGDTRVEFIFHGGPSRVEP